MSTQLFEGDCLEKMKQIPDASVDMVLCDLPYGTTACAWDVVIPFAQLWAQYSRIVKERFAVVLTASQPFTSALVMSKIDWFKHEIIWKKERPTNFMSGKKAPMKYHENILVFSSSLLYNPQYESKPQENKRNNAPRAVTCETSFGALSAKFDECTVIGGSKDWNYPASIQYFSMQRGLHPTQKPVSLMEYLIKTYTNEGDTVLDNCMGSGTTGVACMNTNRNFIGIEKDAKYFQIAKERIEKTQHPSEPSFF